MIRFESSSRLRPSKSLDIIAKDAMLKMKTNQVEYEENLNMAAQYFEREDFQRANHHVTLALSLKNSSPEGLKLQGQIREHIGNKNQAILSFNSSLEIDANQSELNLKVRGSTSGSKSRNSHSDVGAPTSDSPTTPLQDSKFREPRLREQIQTLHDDVEKIHSRMNSLVVDLKVVQQDVMKRKTSIVQGFGNKRPCKKRTLSWISQPSVLANPIDSCNNLEQAPSSFKQVISFTKRPTPNISYFPHEMYGNNNSSPPCFGPPNAHTLSIYEPYAFMQMPESSLKVSDKRKLRKTYQLRKSLPTSSSLDKEKCPRLTGIDERTNVQGSSYHVQMSDSSTNISANLSNYAKQVGSSTEALAKERAAVNHPFEGSAETVKGGKQKIKLKPSQLSAIVGHSQFDCTYKSSVSEFSAKLGPRLEKESPYNAVHELCESFGLCSLNPKISMNDDDESGDIGSDLSNVDDAKSNLSLSNASSSFKHVKTKIQLKPSKLSAVVEQSQLDCRRKFFMPVCNDEAVPKLINETLGNVHHEPLESFELCSSIPRMSLNDNCESGDMYTEKGKVEGGGRSNVEDAKSVESNSVISSNPAAAFKPVKAKIQLKPSKLSAVVEKFQFDSRPKLVLPDCTDEAAPKLIKEPLDNVEQGPHESFGLFSSNSKFSMNDGVISIPTDTDNGSMKVHSSSNMEVNKLVESNMSSSRNPAASFKPVKDITEINKENKNVFYNESLDMVKCNGNENVKRLIISPEALPLDSKLNDLEETLNAVDPCTTELTNSHSHTLVQFRDKNLISDNELTLVNTNISTLMQDFPAALRLTDTCTLSNETLPLTASKNQVVPIIYFGATVNGEEQIESDEIPNESRDMHPLKDDNNVAESIVKAVTEGNWTKALLKSESNKVKVDSKTQFDFQPNSFVKTNNNTKCAKIIKSSQKCPKKKEDPGKEHKRALKHINLSAITKDPQDVAKPLSNNISANYSFKFGSTSFNFFLNQDNTQSNLTSTTNENDHSNNIFCDVLQRSESISKPCLKLKSLESKTALNSKEMSATILSDSNANTDIDTTLKVTSAHSSETNNVMGQFSTDPSLINMKFVEKKALISSTSQSTELISKEPLATPELCYHSDLFMEMGKKTEEGTVVSLNDTGFHLGEDLESLTAFQEANNSRGCYSEVTMGSEPTIKIIPDDDEALPSESQNEGEDYFSKMADYDAGFHSKTDRAIGEAVSLQTCPTSVNEEGTATQSVDSLTEDDFTNQSQLVSSTNDSFNLVDYNDFEDNITCKMSSSIRRPIALPVIVEEHLQMSDSEVCISTYEDKIVSSCGDTEESVSFILKREVDQKKTCENTHFGVPESSSKAQSLTEPIFISTETEFQEQSCSNFVSVLVGQNTEGIAISLPQPSLDVKTTSAANNKTDHILKVISQNNEAPLSQRVDTGLCELLEFTGAIQASPEDEGASSRCSAEVCVAPSERDLSNSTAVCSTLLDSVPTKQEGSALPLKDEETIELCGKQMGKRSLNVEETPASDASGQVASNDHAELVAADLGGRCMLDDTNCLPGLPPAPEPTVLAELFSQLLPSASVNAIRAVDVSHLEGAYRRRKSQYLSRYGFVDEVEMFHVISPRVVSADVDTVTIRPHIFDQEVVFSPYLKVADSFCPGDTSERLMLVCEVLVAECYLVGLPRGGSRRMMSFIKNRHDEYLPKYAISYSLP